MKLAAREEGLLSAGMGKRCFDRGPALLAGGSLSSSAGSLGSSSALESPDGCSLIYLRCRLSEFKAMLRAFAGEATLFSLFFENRLVMSGASNFVVFVTIHTCDVVLVGWMGLKLIQESTLLSFKSL